MAQIGRRVVRYDTMAEVTEALARNMCAAGWSLANREAPTPVELPPAGPSLAPWPAPPGPLPPPKRRSPKPWWARAGPGPSIPRSAGGESQTGATAKPKTSARRLCPRLFLSTDDDDRRADFWCPARSTDASSCCCYPPLHFSFAAFRKPYSAALSCRIFCGGPACEIRRLLGVLNWRPTFSSSRLPTPVIQHSIGHLRKTRTSWSSIIAPSALRHLFLFNPRPHPPRTAPADSKTRLEPTPEPSGICITDPPGSRRLSTTLCGAGSPASPE